MQICSVLGVGALKRVARCGTMAVIRPEDATGERVSRLLDLFDAPPGFDMRPAVVKNSLP